MNAARHLTVQTAPLVGQVANLPFAAGTGRKLGILLRGGLQTVVVKEFMTKNKLPNFLKSGASCLKKWTPCSSLAPYRRRRQ
jgi:hypothetical protein